MDMTSKPQDWQGSHDYRSAELLAREWERHADKAGQAEANCIRLGMPVDASSAAALRALDIAFKEVDRLEKAEALLREARTTLEMWKDVAPAISLCADIDKVLKPTHGAS